MDVVGKVITKQTAINLEQKSETARNAKMKQLKASQLHASARVQQRLVKRKTVKAVEKRKVTRQESAVKVEPRQTKPQKEAKTQSSKGSAPMEIMVKQKLVQMGRTKVEFMATKLQINRGTPRDDGRVFLSKKHMRLLLTRLGITDANAMARSMQDLVSSDLNHIERNTFLNWVFGETEVQEIHTGPAIGNRHSMERHGTSTSN